jgi:alpha-glucosidase
MVDWAWWQRGIIYQIYPRSFQDSNDDGVGDLRGILRRLPYLAQLGIDSIWLSPIFVSPMDDFGYDVADYCAIDPLFGTMDDFNALLEACHAARLKLLLDFVPNHTSDRHPWFVESRSERDSGKRDWYLWRDPAPDGGPPNNWLSEFGGSAWAYDEASGQYYYHAFLASQPDLNWRNPDVREAMANVLRFWLDKGVDGFRIDVLWHLIKDDAFRDNPENPDFRPGDPPHQRLLPLHTTDRPEVHDIVAGFRRVADEFSDRLLIGEIYLPPKRLVAYYGKDLEGVHLPFNFGLLEAPWHARHLARLIDDYEAALPPGSWPNWVLGNHDRPRIVTRVGATQARAAAMLLLTLRGTPTIYYGDEIGMEDAFIPPELVSDPLGKNVPQLGRDGARSPMLWNNGPRAGFSTVDPWTILHQPTAEMSVEAQKQDPSSMFNLHRRLISIRQDNTALSVGSYRAIVATGDLLMFVREHGEGPTFLVALNLGDQPAAAVIHEAALSGTIALSTFCDREGERIDGAVDLRPNEGLLIRLGDPEAPAQAGAGMR